jgi:hypothetical protein
MGNGWWMVCLKPVHGQVACVLLLLGFVAAHIIVFRHHVCFLDGARSLAVHFLPYVDSTSNITVYTNRRSVLDLCA